MLADPMTHESDDWGHFLLAEFIISECFNKSNNKMKYIIVNFKDMTLFPIIFKEQQNHSDFKALESEDSVRIVSAGFCEHTLIGFKVDETRAYSESLGIETKNVIRDELIINEAVVNGNMISLGALDDYKQPRLINPNRCLPIMTEFSGKIEKLKIDEVFVFGSNTRGKHAGGDDYIAYKKFGAQMGVAEGFTGNCYAIPIIDIYGHKVSGTELLNSFKKFLREVVIRPETKFYLTPIGTGIAGWESCQITSIIQRAAREEFCQLLVNGCYIPKNLCIHTTLISEWDYQWDY